LLLAVSLLVGHFPTWRWLLLPVPLLSLQATGFALGLLCGTLNVFFRDIGQLLMIGLQVLLWTVPVIWVTETLVGSVPLLGRLLPWHPLVPPLAAIRICFCMTDYPPRQSGPG